LVGASNHHLSRPGSGGRTPTLTSRLTRELPSKHERPSVAWSAWCSGWILFMASLGWVKACPRCGKRDREAATSRPSTCGLGPHPRQGDHDDPAITRQRQTAR
jgi:hypothetical protein